MSTDRVPPPEPAGPEQGHQDHGPVSVREAARVLGISDRAVRKRIKAGTVQGHFIGNAWLVYLPEAEPPGPEQGRGSEVPMGRGTVPRNLPEPVPGPEQFRLMLEALAAEHQAAIDALTTAHAGTIAAQDALIAELRRRADLAEAEVARLAASTPASAPEPRRRWWRFW